MIVSDRAKRFLHPAPCACHGKGRQSAMGVAAVERALALVGAFTEQDQGLGLAELAQRAGIDLDHLLAARKIVTAGMPGEPLYVYVPDAGITKGIVPASGRA